MYFYFAYEPLSHFRNNDAGIVLGTWRKRRGQSLKWKMSSIRMQWRDEVEKKINEVLGEEGMRVVEEMGLS